MAKLISTRQFPGLDDKIIPMIEVVPQPLMSPPKGLNLTARLSRVSPNESADIKNLVLDDQTLLSRLGTSAVGTAANNIMAVVSFVSPSQTGVLLRFTTTGFDKWNGSAWVAVKSNIFSGGTSDYFEFVGWGNSLLVCNGVDKIYSYNSATGEAGFLDQSVPAKHISVFGGRVVLTGTFEGGYRSYRIRWSVKNNNTDWTGDGSGYEDLFAMPGGLIDSAHGVFPITDDTALIIRDNSVWQMSLTGNILAAFRFSQVMNQVGTKFPRTISAVPGGFMFVSRNDIVMVQQSGVQIVGTNVRSAVLAAITNRLVPVGYYDLNRNEYRLAIDSTVYRYSFRDQGWTRDIYPVKIRDWHKIEYDKLVLTIDELSGTIDSLVGTIDEQVLAGTANSLMMAVHEGAASSLVVKEDDSATADVIVDGTASAVEILAATSLIMAATPLQKSKVIEIQLEYEATVSQTLLFEYSTDKGSTWSSYSSTTIVATSGPQILSVRKTIVGHNIQLRIRSTTLGGLRVIAFLPHVVAEAKVHP